MRHMKTIFGKTFVEGDAWKKKTVFSCCFMDVFDSQINLFEIRYDIPSHIIM